MTCAQAMALMSAKLDGALDAGQADALQAHLEGCPDCRRLAKTMAGLDKQISGLREHAPAGLKDGVLYRIDQATGKGKRRRRAFGPGTAIGAVAAVLVLLVGLKIVPLTQNTKEQSAAADLSQNEPMQTDMVETAAPGFNFVSPPMQVGTDAWKDAEKTQTDSANQTEPSGLLDDGYYRSGGESGETRNDPRPITPALQTACAALSEDEGAMVLLYTEFSPQTLFELLRSEEPALAALTETLRFETADGLLRCKTDCATALAIHEWLLENLPQSEVMDGELREAETRLRIRMEELDPGSGSLYRVITWTAPTHPVVWPGSWADGWAVRLRTEENWGLFFPDEHYAPALESPAYLVFPAP